jgi:general secretion pathway protein D
MIAHPPRLAPFLRQNFVRLRLASVFALVPAAFISSGWAQTTPQTPPPAASELAREAREAEAKDRISEAYLLYTQASALSPGNRSYRTHADALRTRAALLSKPLETNSAQSTPASADADPEPYFDNLTARELAEAGRLQAPPELKPRSGRFNIDLEGDSKTLFQQVSAVYGLDCIFDSDYEPGPRLRFHLSQADYRDALYSLSSSTNSFIVILSPKLFLVAKDTPQKRTDLEQTMSVVIPVPQAISSQELIEIAQAIRQATGVEKLAWDNKANSIIIRDRISRVIPAQGLLEDLLAYRPQVMIAMQVIEVRKSDMFNYGINLPNAFNIFFTGMGVNTSGGGTLPANTSNPFPFNSRTFNFIATATQGSATTTQAVFHGLFPTSLSLWSISIAEATALANFAASAGRTILATDLRSADAMPATFHLGERYPILTSTYNVGVSVGAQYVPPPSFRFEDLGVTLKITPHIHGTKAVSLDLDSDFKVLSGGSVNGNPIISSRTLKSSVSLEDDEWAVVAGLTQQTDSRTAAGTAGVSQIPLVGQLFQQVAKDKESSEILILMKPRLLNLPGNQHITKELRVGSEARPFTPL